MRITLGSKIAFAFVILLMLMGSLGIFTYCGIKKNVDLQRAIGKEAIKQTDAGNLRFIVTQVIMASNDYIITNDTLFIKAYKFSDSLLNKYYSEFTNKDLAGNEKLFLNKIKSNIDSIRTYSKKIFLIKKPNGSKQAIEFMKMIDYNFGININLQTTKFYNDISKRIKEYHTEGERIKKNQAIIIPSLIAVGFLFSLVIVILSIQKITKPIKVLKTAAAEVASGNLTIRLDIKTNDEIESLAISFCAMTESIAKTFQELQKVNLNKDKLLSIIAHDLRNTFASLLGYTNFIIDDFEELKKENVLEYVIDINRIIKNTLGLLNDLVDWSRMQTDRINYDPSTNSINNLFNRLSELYVPVARSKGVEIIFCTAGDLKGFYDNDMIYTVLRNLISNAIKFSKSGTAILVNAYDDQDKIKIEVKDQGIGIPQHVKGNIFNIGQSVSTKGTNDEQGTGLGLVLCKEFVEKNNGQIWFESKEGRGTAFYFTLLKEASMKNVV